MTVEMWRIYSYRKLEKLLKMLKVKPGRIVDFKINLIDAIA